jgi:hypothetical protein
MNTQYIIQVGLSIISFAILISVYSYLDDLKSCACFVENQHPKYRINIDFLQMYQILEILSLFVFIAFITMYKNKLLKGGALTNNSGIKFFVLLSILLFMFISGYVSYYSILLFLTSKKDCVCANQWQKYIIYIQGTFNTIYVLRICFALVFISLLLAFK